MQITVTNPFKGRQYPGDVILQAVRWYLRYPLAYEHFSNYTGLATAMVLLLLLLISNDISLRKLGIKRWKALQRFSYLAFALTMAHGAAYQLVEKQHRGWVFAFGGMA
jgi:sulfoxide reductase heme-binding subunit YedZ